MPPIPPTSYIIYLNVTIWFITNGHFDLVCCSFLITIIAKGVGMCPMDYLETRVMDLSAEATAQKPPTNTRAYAKKPSVTPQASCLFPQLSDSIFIKEYHHPLSFLVQVSPSPSCPNISLCTCRFLIASIKKAAFSPGSRVGLLQFSLILPWKTMSAISEAKVQGEHSHTTANKD